MNDQPEDFWTQFRRGWRVARRQAAAALHEAVNTETIRVAVTGLSRAGKTVFITSAVQNLLAMAEGKGALPKFDDHAISDRLKKLGLLAATAAVRLLSCMARFMGASPRRPCRRSVRCRCAGRTACHRSCT